MQTTAIVVAAGPGTRLKGGGPKGFVPIAGVPLFIRALRAMDNAATISAIVAVVPPAEQPKGVQFVETHGPWRCPVSVVEGGAERQDSVRAGIAAATGTDLIAIHDAARPFVRTEVTEAVVAMARRHGAAIVAIPASDTVKQVHADGWVEATPPRDHLWLAQTPQVFRADIIRTAHERAAADGVIATDDAALVERMGVRVYVVAGNPENRKITTPDDLRWAEWLLSAGSGPR